MKKIRKGLLYIMLPVLAIMLGLGTYALTTHVNVRGGTHLEVSSKPETEKTTTTTENKKTVIKGCEFYGSDTFLHVKEGMEVVVEDCVFSGATDRAVIVEGGTLTLNNSDIINGNSDSNGLAIDIYGGSFISLNNVNIEGNKSETGQGLVSLHEENIIININENTTILNNSVSSPILVDANNVVINFNSGAIGNNETQNTIVCKDEKIVELNFKNFMFENCGDSFTEAVRYNEEYVTVNKQFTLIPYVDGNEYTSIDIMHLDDIETLSLPKTLEECCGWFLDNEYIKVYDIEEFNKYFPTMEIKLYTRTATPEKLTFTSNGDGLTCNVKALNNEIQGEVVIPAKNNELVVVNIFEGSTTTEGAFYQCKYMNSIILNTNISNIAKYSFYEAKIKSINLTNRIIEIGSNAFTYSGLTTIKFPDSLVKLGSYAFYNSLSNVEEIYIPKRLTTIESNVFSFCYSIKSVVVDAENSVYEDRGLNAIIEKETDTVISGFYTTILDDSIKVLGDGAFRGTSIIKIEIPESVVEIRSAFSNCYYLASIKLPSLIKGVGTYCFSQCKALKAIDMSKTQITNISPYAFEGCSSLTAVILPDTLTNIANGAFKNCTSLTSIYIPSSVTGIYGYKGQYLPFFGCSVDLKIYCGVDTKPTDWGDYWNYYSITECYVDNVNLFWGVTREEYNQIVSDA